MNSTRRPLNCTIFRTYACRQHRPVHRAGLPSETSTAPKNNIAVFAKLRCPDSATLGSLIKAGYRHSSAGGFLVQMVTTYDNQVWPKRTFYDNKVLTKCTCDNDVCTICTCDNALSMDKVVIQKCTKKKKPQKKPTHVESHASAVSVLESGE